MGVSGVITVGCFTFAYSGVDPQCNFLTGNTFDPLDTLLSRPGVVQNREKTRSAEKAEAVLVETLQEVVPAMVWADAWSLPYGGWAGADGTCASS